jgi:MATE family multidrug resistance protein
MSPNRDDLLEPLLSSTDEQAEAGPRVDEEEAAVSSPEGEQECTTEENDEETQEFSVRTEISEMLALGVPLAVSFFCRMGMASTDSAFVGHIHDGLYSAEIYLAAAVLSDMCVNVFVTPPLAFNQVLNGLVGQAMGSGNPKMAGIWLQQSMFWLSVSMLPFLLAFFYVEPILIALNFPEDIAQIAGTYAKYNLIWPVPNGLCKLFSYLFFVISKVHHSRRFIIIIKINVCDFTFRHRAWPNLQCITTSFFFLSMHC